MFCDEVYIDKLEKFRLSISTLLRPIEKFIDYIFKDAHKHEKPWGQAI